MYKNKITATILEKFNFSQPHTTTRTNFSPVLIEYTKKVEEIQTKHNDSNFLQRNFVNNQFGLQALLVKLFL